MAYPLPPPATQAPPKSSPASIKSFLLDKVGTLGAIVQDVRAEMRRRSITSRRVRQLIDDHYFYVRCKLLELYTWPLGRVSAIDQRRKTLEAELDTLLHEKRREMVDCTDQIATLKKELWRWLKEYQDLMVRLTLIVGNKNGNRYT